MIQLIDWMIVGWWWWVVGDAAVPIELDGRGSLYVERELRSLHWSSPEIPASSYVTQQPHLCECVCECVCVRWRE